MITSVMLDVSISVSVVLNIGSIFKITGGFEKAIRTVLFSLFN